VPPRSPSGARRCLRPILSLFLQPFSGGATLAALVEFLIVPTGAQVGLVSPRSRSLVGEPMHHESAEISIGDDFVPKLKDSVVPVTVGDETVLFDSDSGALHQLDPIGTIVCRHFDGGNMSAIVKELCSLFAAPRRIIEADVFQLVRQLVGKGVLDCDEPGLHEGDAPDDSVVSSLYENVPPST
jgi:hypothetical protein